ncbi:MAG: hypothetical protein AB7P49_16225 [Bdellovibrionales bacterium]
MSLLEAGLLAVCLVGLAYFGILAARSRPLPQSGPHTLTIRSSSQKFPPLLLPEGIDLYDQLSTDTRNRLDIVVENFCSQDFDGNTCVHFLVKCGRPCLALLTPAEQKRALDHYISARAARRMPALTSEGHL